MSEKKRMRHPDLDAEYLAQPEQVPHMGASGWYEVEGDDAGKQAHSSQATAGRAGETDTPRRRRKTSEES